QPALRVECPWALGTVLRPLEPPGRDDDVEPPVAVDVRDPHSVMVQTNVRRAGFTDRGGYPGKCRIRPGDCPHQGVATADGEPQLLLISLAKQILVYRPFTERLPRDQVGVPQSVDALRILVPVDVLILARQREQIRPAIPVKVRSPVRIAVAVLIHRPGSILRDLVPGRAV